MGFIQMLRTGRAGANMAEGIPPVASDIPPLGKVGNGNPIAVATKGAERAALNDYGRTLVDRANNIKE
jgi:hypothetical protein